MRYRIREVWSDLDGKLEPAFNKEQVNTQHHDLLGHE